MVHRRVGVLEDRVAIAAIGGKTLMPMEGEVQLVLIDIDGRRGALMILPATMAASVTWLMSGRRMTNSSPPMRADGVGLPDGRRKARQATHAKFVAHLVAEGIVDHFEAVEVEEHDRDLPAVPAGFRARPGRAACEGQAVRQSGQRIVLGHMTNPILVPGGAG